MTPANEPTSANKATIEKPRLALAVATALGVGYIPKAPGTFGSLVGVATAFLSAVFFLRPANLGSLLSLHPNYEAVLKDNHFLVPGSDIHNSIMALPIFCALGLLLLLGAIGVWSASRAAAYARIEDPQFVVIDEVAGQHLALLLPLIPIALPRLTAHEDFSIFAIFFALSLVNWKYLLLGFILFRVFDIWKPWPVRRLEKLPGGWGVMADDWMAGIYAAILLRVALHFGLLTFHIGWV
ncbi:MAG TPA: phosphatidylglycerophosphatase A [Candidatus Acidoferrum sp.]|nr:phosphatidylglycerophosphatase A [Candidatus Acidoferrum sp.]